MEQLATQPLGVGVFLAGAGITFMLLGHRIFRALIAVSFGVLGFLVGSAFGPGGLMSVFAGLLVGIGLGAIST